ncbi:MAG: hypothetical protein E6I87_09580 [Chloroflexi bacterium]|nr:MAG: hypothetical protein E6I87_09580 [Chloroflexota bacterium]
MSTHRAVVALLIVAVMAYGAPATAAAGDFHSRWVDQAAWPTLAPNATTSYTIRYRNTGTAAWVRGSAAQANLAVNGDDTRFAQLGIAVGWLSSNRIATTVEATVAPGATGTFTFSLRAPPAVGAYRIPLRLVLDGVTWMEDEGVFLVLVSDAGLHGKWVSQSPWPSGRSGDSSGPITLSFRNTGTRPWAKGVTEVHLAVAGDDLSWAAYGINWLFGNRPATQNETTVAPGQLGTFTFTLTFPATPGAFRLPLRLVVDGLTWLEDEGVFVLVTVTGDTRIPILDDVVVQSGLNIPWDIAFAPDGRMFVTERPGRLRVYAGGAPGAALLGTTTIANMHADGEAGLMGVALDPSFAGNGLVYLCASRDDEGQWRNQVLRYRMSGSVAAFDAYVVRRGALANSNHDGCRIRFGPDGKLWVTMGEAGDGSRAQDPNLLNGKILRLNPDGSIPADNPILPGAAGRSAVFTWGHRNPQGIAFQPVTNTVWEIEHGPECDDEINVIVGGRNYGWPNVTGNDGAGGYADPAWSSGCPTIAPSGATFVTGPAWASWSGSLFVAVLKDTDLRRFVAQGVTATQTNVLYHGKYGRLRAAVQGPDGALYVTTSNGGSDRVVRITPR